MSIFSNPFDSKVRLRCACGQHESDAAHQASLSALGANSVEAQQSRVVEQAVLRAMFPQDALRRRFLQAVGAPTALAAISSVFPLALAKEAFAQGGKLEKPNLKLALSQSPARRPSLWRIPWVFIKSRG